MKRLTLISIIICLLASCGVYRKYENKVFSSAITISENTDIPSWREYFADPYLQSLIDSALARNTDLAIAAIRTHQAEENLKTSKLAYFPSVSLLPTGSLNLEKGRKADWDYQLSANVSWSYGSPGSLFARKQEAQARVIQMQDRNVAIKSGIIAQMATSYYYLQLLDEKVHIIENTINSWTKSIDTQKELLYNAKVMLNSVTQMESMLLDLRNDLATTQEGIIEMERNINLLLAQPYRPIKRSNSKEEHLIPIMDKGVTLDMLRARADIRAVERDMEIAYYITSEAKSAFYPSILLTGDFGWPTVIKSILSITQPIFANGTLKSHLNITKMDQEIVQLNFNQALLNASTEVSQALADYRLAREKEEINNRQVKVLAEGQRVLDELSLNGRTNYLEIIKSQEKHLDAMIDECTNRYESKVAAVKLYWALGGGCE